MNFDRLIASTGALFALAVLAAFGVDAHFSRREALESAEREVQKSAAVLAERVRQMFGAADRALVAAAVAHQAWQRDPGANTASGRRILRALADSSDVIEDIAWFGPDGARQITSAQDRQGRLDASQLDFFNVHTARTDRGLYIGKSFRLVADGPWITPVSRRMDDDSGKFIGVAAAVLDAKYIGSVLEPFHAANGAAYAIILESGRLLRQIIVNLLTNGIKFTERGGKVSLGWDRRPDGRLALVVADTGVGMTEEDCRRVMEPFGRGSAELARARHDTGLGLTLCRQFAEMHGGHIELASALGKGTTVSVIMPASRVIRCAGRTAAAA